ncbi:MAG: hypothetical protein EBU52_15590 [Cytophagia bacterium]|nr:hypothetical protein [Cytophagia bacterium]
MILIQLSYGRAFRCAPDSFLTILGSDHYMAAEALIDYKRKDGKVVALPCVTMIERNAAGEATSVRIFIDTAPIFQTEIK